VVLPEGVDALEHEELLEVLHGLGAHLRRLLLVVLPQGGLQLLLEGGVVVVVVREARLLGREPEGLAEDGGEGVPVPLRGVLAGGAVAVDVVFRDVLGQVDDVLVRQRAGEDLLAEPVDLLPLLVHDVVVLEEVLADVEVPRLDLLLGALDRVGDPSVLDRDPFLHPEPLHQAREAVGPEEAHEVVLEREVETGGAGVALAAGAAAQLVVDAARLVALGADDVEAARGDDLLVGLGALDLRLLEELLVLLGRLALAPLPGEELGVAAEEDVGAAARHVRRDRHAPGCPACATMAASCSWYLAFRTTWGTPRFFSSSARYSDFSIEIVPTSTGCFLS
jgi:hypothetical protein